MYKCEVPFVAAKMPNVVDKSFFGVCMYVCENLDVYHTRRVKSTVVLQSVCCVYDYTTCTVHVPVLYGMLYTVHVLCVHTACPMQNLGCKIMHASIWNVCVRTVRRKLFLHGSSHKFPPKKGQSFTLLLQAHNIIVRTA